jgi:cyclopropane-fatty-acyl-phospholipid synthase
MLLTPFFNRLIVRGTMTVIDSGGKNHRFGTGAEPRVTIRLHNRKAEWRILLDPELGVAECYMDGDLTIEGASLYDFLHLAGANIALAGDSLPTRARRRIGLMFRRIAQHNTLGRARRNVAHHYDLSGELYDMFLDTDRQYSCAYFEHPGDDLETAQENKKRHIAAKMLLEPDHTVLDIGSGWGGLGLYLAGLTEAEVHGVTLSAEQHKASQQRAEEAGLNDRLKFSLRDYRHETGTYDRIVSVGMFEHIGVGHYDEFFGKVRDLLAPDGVALLHTIGRVDEPGTTHPFAAKYIFPGGYVPALSEVMAPLQRSGMFVTDIEVLRLHYADTLRHWRENFMANWDRARALYDERFCRMWEFYLAGSEVSFRCLGLVVFQIQLARQQDTVPLTRDYIADWERAQRPRDRWRDVRRTG